MSQQTTENIVGTMGLILLGVIVLGFLVGGVAGAVVLGLHVLFIFGALALIGASGPKPDPRILAWYESALMTATIRPYASSELATVDANCAAIFGWTIQSVTTGDGHVSVGRTASGAVFTDGMSLLLGGSHARGNVTVTFVRQANPVAVSV